MHRPGRQTASHCPAHAPQPVALRQHQAIPAPHPHKDGRSKQRRKRKPTHCVLPVRDDDKRSQQRPNGTAPVAAHLEDGLRQALPAARRHLRHPRSLGVEYRRAATYHRHRQQDDHEARRKSQRQQPQQRETHARRQRVRLRVPVGILPHKRLEDGRRQLKYQRDDTNLREGKAETILQQGVHGGDNRLNHIVQQMAKTHGKQHGIRRPLLHLRMPLYSIQQTDYLHVSFKSYPDNQAAAKVSIFRKSGK